MIDLLRAEGINKHYDGIYALKDVDAAIAPGEVHALMGENGAGKSTLAKVLAGSVKPEAGRIWFEGRPVTISSPAAAQRLGIGIIYQELDLFPDLSVAENLVIGNLRMERRPFVSFRDLDRFCRPFLDQVGLACRPDTMLSALPIGQMQLVAIARALSMEARLILMDEPTSSLSDDSVETLFRLIANLKQRGVSVVYVSHKLSEIFRISDRVTVLRDGAVVGTRVTSGTSPEELIRMVVGRALRDRAAVGRNSTGEVLLSARSLTTAKLKGVSFDLRRGEVLGVAGLVGAGRSELGAALFGLDRITAGSLLLKGRPVRPRSAGEAMKAGLGLLPEDRKLQGLMMQMSVLENGTLAVLNRFQSAGFLQGAREKSAMRQVDQRLALKCPSYDAPVSSLSGGNQQKVLLARWLLADPDLLFLDDPTRGIDVGAKQDIYEMISRLASAGKGVIFVSSELPELLACCDRILVLHDGRVTGLFEASGATQERLMAAAMNAA